MGALHAGHARLIEVARKEIGRKQSGVVVVSIFVNPIQFDRQEDYEQYGRDFRRRRPNSANAPGLI